MRAARTCFGRDGYRRASIRAIAREADVATGAVYQFFGSKRVLLLVSMDELLRHLEEVAPPAFPARETLLRDLERFLRVVFARERPFVGAYRAWQEAALVDPSIADHDRHVRAWTRHRIGRLLALIVRLPGARPGLDLETLARLWDDMFWGLLAKRSSNPERTIRALARLLAYSLFSDE